MFYGFCCYFFELLVNFNLKLCVYTLNFATHKF